MPVLDLYHGADSAKMLYNVQHRGLTTDALGQLYFAQHQWTNCLVHGTDSDTRESYVAKVRANIPDPPIAQIDRTPRSGNPDALIVTMRPGHLVSCEFLELYVRSGTRDEGFHTATIPGPGIEGYLAGKRA